MKERRNKNSIMTLTEVADYLKLSERTILRLVHQGVIPGSKIGSQWRFMQSVIDDWLLTSIGNKNDGEPVEPGKYSVSGFLDPGYILLHIKPGPKESIIQQLLQPVIEQKLIPNPSLVIARLLSRENISSTGIGNGVAFPHIRNPRENSPDLPPIVAGVCREGVDFHAIDEIPVTLFFLLSFNRESIHLNIMSRLGLLLREARIKTALLKAASPGEFIHIIKENEG
jgi:nitrogen PTS system EIIA component